LEIFDVDLLNELAHYQIRDLKSKKKPGMTRHFDLLIALAIAWQLKDFATPDKKPDEERRVREVRAERKNEFFN